jgi:RES domain-containing protein
MLWFRHADRRFPFLWESDGQPPARWHGAGEGPTQYLASTPDGAWAEFLRHEEIRDAAELAGIERAMWAVELSEDSEHLSQPALPEAALLGGLDSYPACRVEARRLRANGATAVQAPSAALLPGTARGQRVESGLIEADAVEGRVLAVFGRRPKLRGWLCAQSGRPAERVLGLVRHL